MAKISGWCHVNKCKASEQVAPLACTHTKRRNTECLTVPFTELPIMLTSTESKAIDKGSERKITHCPAGFCSISTAYNYSHP